MMRFWDVNEGKINLDNKNIKEVNTASLRNSQTLVSQETYLFNESILDNIKIGNPSASKDEVIQAAKMASIHLLSIYLMDMILLLQAMVKDYLKDKDNYLLLQEQQLLIHQF